MKAVTMENKKLKSLSIVALIMSVLSVATLIPASGSCRLIYIFQDLGKAELTENGNNSVTVQLQAGANYIGIYGMDYSGTIQITIE